MSCKNKTEKFSDNQSSQCEELLNPPGGAILYFVLGVIFFFYSLIHHFYLRKDFLWPAIVDDIMVGIFIVISVVLLSIGGWKYSEYEMCKENNSTPANTTPA